MNSRGRGHESTIRPPAPGYLTPLGLDPVDCGSPGALGALRCSSQGRVGTPRSPITVVCKALAELRSCTGRREQLVCEVPGWLLSGSSPGVLSSLSDKQGSVSFSLWESRLLLCRRGGWDRELPGQPSLAQHFRPLRHCLGINFSRARCYSWELVSDPGLTLQSDEGGFQFKPPWFRNLSLSFFFCSLFPVNVCQSSFFAGNPGQK